MDVIGTFGRHDVVGLLGLLDSVRRWAGSLVLDHPLDGSGPQVKSRASQDLRDLAFAEGRAQGLESLDDVPDVVRELVDRLSKLDQGGVSILVDSLQPRGYGRWSASA